MINRCKYRYTLIYLYNILPSQLLIEVCPFVFFFLRVLYFKCFYSISNLVCFLYVFLRYFSRVTKRIETNKTYSESRWALIVHNEEVFLKLNFFHPYKPSFVVKNDNIIMFYILFNYLLQRHRPSNKKWTILLFIVYISMRYG